MNPLPDRFTASPSPVPAGDQLEICFTNPALAGTKVTITLDNGEGQSASVDIDLNSEGYGCTSWTVPSTGWDIVKMNQPTSLEHMVVVE